MRAGFAPILILFGGLFAGCRALPSLQPADLQAPGWWVSQGQAVWTRKRGDEGVAGELLVATRGNGECFVQFAKPPFTLATAQWDGDGWSAETLPSSRRKGGRGQPPSSNVWFALARALRGQGMAGEWIYRTREAAGWCLTNAVSGEVVEGYLSP